MYGPNQKIYFRRGEKESDYKLKQHPDYPFHWQQLPCPGFPNCYEGFAHPNCGNCTPAYVSRELCLFCHLPSGGGRFTCCVKPICQICCGKRIKIGEIHDLCGKRAGYFNNRNEIPIMKFKL